MMHCLIIAFVKFLAHFAELIGTCRKRHGRSEDNQIDSSSGCSNEVRGEAAKENYCFQCVEEGFSVSQANPCVFVTNGACGLISCVGDGLGLEEQCRSSFYAAGGGDGRQKQKNETLLLDYYKG